jgi:hypothetical protein
MFVPHNFVLFKNVRLGIVDFSVSFILAHTWLSLCPLHGQHLRDLGSAAPSVVHLWAPVYVWRILSETWFRKMYSQPGLTPLAQSDSNKPHHTTMRIKPLPH